MSNLSESSLETLQIQRLDILRIRTDGCTQARASLKKETITEYVEAMRVGEIFPPLTVFYDGKDYWLADGFHRLEAAKTIQASEISVYVQQGSRREAILYAVGANTKHGLRRSNADKRRAVEILLNDPEWSQWSNRELAKRCGVSLDLVNRLRQKMNPTERIVQSKNSTDGFSSESSGANGLTPQLKRKCADGRIINVGNIGKTLTNSSNDIPLFNAKEANPALTINQSKEEQPLPIEGFEMDWLSKEPSGLMSQLQSKNSNYIRVLSIENENYQQFQDIVQTLEITSTGLHVKLECCPLMLVNLFQQMQENPAFTKEVLQQAILLAEKTK